MGGDRSGRIFISYSRKDGKDFAADMRKMLEGENLFSKLDEPPVGSCNKKRLQDAAGKPVFGLVEVGVCGWATKF
jgi:hypothetical protein